MAKTLADVFPSGKKKGGALADVLSARAPKADGGTSVESVLAQNDVNRARLAAAGQDDPTVRKPSTLDRLFGVLDTPGTAVRATVYNMLNPGLQNDVNIADEIGNALAGEDRVQGADFVEGIDNKWAQMGTGFAIDVLLDPLTYLTFGYGGAAKSTAEGAVGKLAATRTLDASRLASALNISDDIARGIFKVIGESGDDVVDFAVRTPDDSRKFMRAVMDATGDQGGVKFLGTTLFKGKGLQKGADTIGDLVKSTKPVEWFDKAFRYGDLADVYREGNQVINAGVDYARRKLSGKIQVGNRLADAFEKQLAQAIPDERERMWVSVAIGRQFNDPDKIRALAGMVDDLDAAYKSGDDEAVSGLIDGIAEFRSDLLDPAAVERTLRDAGFTDDAIARAMPVIEDFRLKMAENLARQREAGVNIADLTLGGADSAGYLPGMRPRARTGGSQETLARVLDELEVDPASLRDGKPTTFSEFVRGLRPDAGGQKTFLTPEDRLAGRTIDDILGGADATAKPIETELDLAILGGEATRKANKNVAFGEYQQELTQLFGKGKEADAVAKDLLSRTEKLFTNDEATQGMLRVYDKSLNTWKKWATIYNLPRFPMRNFGSNKVLQWMRGVLDPVAEEQSFRLIGLTRNADEVARILSDDVGRLTADERLIREAFEDRVLTTSREMTEQVGTGPTAFQNANLVKRFEGFSGGINELVENQSRLSAYIAARKTMGREGAAEMVDKALYSYDPAMLTSFERNFMRRLVPFYVWMRRNTPNMVELLVTDPKRIAVFGHLKESGEAVTDIDQSVMPEWMRNAFPIPLPLTDTRGNTVTTIGEGTLPIGDLDLVASALTNPKSVPKTLLTNLSPLIKTPLEIIMNRDLYYGDEVASYKGQTRRAPGYVEQFDDIASAIPGLDVVWGGVRQWFNMQEKQDPDTGDVYLAMDAYAVKALKDLNPWMNAVGKMLDENPKQVYDQFSYLSGIKAVPYDTAQFTRQQAYQDQRDLQDATRAAVDAGLMIPASERAKPKTLQDIFGGR